MARAIKGSFKRIAAVVLTLAGVANADTIYWDGTGTDWTQAANWSLSSSATTPDPGAAPGASDTAVFNISTVPAAQTIDLNGNQSVNGIVLPATANSGSPAGTITIQNGTGTNTLTIGSGGITQLGTGNGFFVPTSGALNINTTNLVLDGSQTWNLNGGLGMNSSSVITPGATSATLRLNSTSQGAFANFTGTLADNGPAVLSVSIYSTAPSTSIAGVVYSTANTYSGTTTVRAQSFATNFPTLYLTTKNATILNSDLIADVGGVVYVGYGGGDTPDATTTRAKSLALRGGAFNAVGSANGNSNEQFTNGMSFTGGGSILQVTPNAASNTAITGSFSRTNGATVLFRGNATLGAQAPGTGTGTGNIVFSNPGSLGLVGGGTAYNTTTASIIPWAYGDNGATGFVTYDATNGVRLLDASTGYAINLTSGATTNVRLTSNQARAANQTVNSLIVSGAASTTRITGAFILTVTSGAVMMDAAATGNQTITGGTLSFNGAQAVFTNASASQLLVVDAVTNTGGNGLVKTGTGRINFNAAANLNTFTGTIYVHQGVFGYFRDDSLGDSNNDIVIYSGASFNNFTTSQQSVGINRTVTLVGPNCIIGGNTGQTNGTTINGTVEGDGQLVVSGGSNSFGVTLANAGNTFTGGVGINRGFLAITTDSNLGTAPTSAVADHIIFGGSSGFAQLLRINGDVTTGVGRGITLTNVYSAPIEVASTRTWNYAGAISDSAAGASGWTKQGAGTMKMGGVSTYTGATAVNAGSLILTAGGSLANTAVTTAAGATFGANPTALSGPGTATIGTGTASVTMQAGSTFRMGGDAATGTVNVDGTLTLEGTSGTPNQLFFDLGELGSFSDRIVTTGNVTAANAGGTVITVSATGAFLNYGAEYLVLDAGNALTASSFVLGNAGSQITVGSTVYDLELHTNGDQLSVYVVPEPAAAAVLVVGALGLLARRRRNGIA